MINATKIWGSNPSHPPSSHCHHSNRSGSERCLSSSTSHARLSTGPPSQNYGNDAIEGIVSYFAQSEDVHATVGARLSHYLADTNAVAIGGVIQCPVVGGGGGGSVSPFDTPPPSVPTLPYDASAGADVSSARRLEPLCIDATISFDFICLGSVSPAAVQLFLEYPWGMFQSCANAALRRWMEGVLFSFGAEGEGSHHPSNLGMACPPSPAPLASSLSGMASAATERTASFYDFIPEHLRTFIASRPQQASLLRSLQCKIWLLPIALPIAFMPTIATAPHDIGRWFSASSIAQRQDFPLHPRRRGGAAESRNDGFLLCADAVVSGLCFASLGNVAVVGRSSRSSCSFVELSRVRPRSPDASSSYAARHLFVESSIVADLRHLGPVDQAEFVLGCSVRFMGQCIAIPSTAQSYALCGERSSRHHLQHSESVLGDIPPALLRSATHVVVVLSLERSGRGHHHPQRALLMPPDIFERFGTEATCAGEAFRCWRGLQDAWCTAQPGMPRGWYLPCYGVDAPIVWAAVMVSAMLPQGTLHAAFVVPSSHFLSHLNAMMALVDAGSGTGGAVTTADRSTLERHALPSVVQLSDKQRLTNNNFARVPAQAIQVVRAGIFNHATGTTLFLPDLDKFSPSSLRLTSKMMRESTVVVQGGVGDIGTSRLQAGNEDDTISTTINFASIATVLGRDASATNGGTITPVDNYLSECDIVVAFNKSSPMEQLKDLQWVLSLHASNDSCGAAVASGEVGWNRLLSILRRDCSSLFTTPQITQCASSILGSYFSVVKAAFPSQVQASLMTVLIRLASAHAVLRAAWSAPILLAEPLLSTVEAHSVDALFAVAIVDAGLSRQLNAPMLAFHFVSDVFSALAHFSSTSSEIASTDDDALTQWYQEYLQSFLSRF